LNHGPLFPGQNDIDQLFSVISVLGSPTSKSWPRLEELPDYNKIQFPESKGISMHQLCPDSSEEAVALLARFLKYNSSDRISAKEVLLIL
jgi:cell cycle related kinase